MVSSLPLAVITALANGRNKLARPLRRGARIVRARPAKGVKHAARGTGTGQLSGSRHPARHCGSRWGSHRGRLPAPLLPPAFRWLPGIRGARSLPRAPRPALRRYVLRGPCVRSCRLAGGSGAAVVGGVLVRGTEVPGGPGGTDVLGGAEMPGGARCVPPFVRPDVLRVPDVLHALHMSHVPHVLPCAGRARCRWALCVSGLRPWPSSRVRPPAVPARPASWAARPHRSARPSRRAPRGRPSGRI